MRFPLFSRLIRRFTKTLPAVFATAALCAQATPAGSLPPNTVQLSDMMRQLSQQPGFTDDFLARLAGGGKQAALPLTPGLRDDLRKLIVGKDWAGLDRFPGWTMDRLNPVVSGIQISKPSAQAADASLDDRLKPYLDLGPYALSQPATIALDQQATVPGFDEKTLVIPLAGGVTTGDPADPQLAPLHAESLLLAEVFTRLSMNQVAGAQPFSVSFHGQQATTPQQLITILAANGEQIEIDDSRYFANFGSLNWASPQGPREVLAPFWLDTRAIIPGTSRTLIVPVSHAEYEIRIHSAQPGQGINAAVSFWFGIDGKVEFRTMDQREQLWVMGHHEHVYTGADAVEVARLAGRIAATYARLHLAHPELPFGGYYRLGVCQDVVAAIELKMSGTTTLFPNTADNDYFPEHAENPADDEVDALIRRLPKDGHGAPPNLERVFGSLPLRDGNAELAKVTIPGLAPDLIAVHDAWKDGTERHSREQSLWIWLALTASLGLIAMRRFLLWRQRRQKPEQP